MATLKISFFLLLVLGFIQSYGQNMESCVQGLCIGQRAYNIERNYREVEVVGFEYNNKFVIRFLDTGAIGGNWDRSDLAVTYGCSGQYCVGQEAYNIERNYRLVHVVGIQYDGRMVLRFQDNGGIGGNWTASDLAIPKGCGRLFCVGDLALNNKRDYRQVVVVAIQNNLKYVLRFQDTGAVGGNWDDEDLVRVSGHPPQPPPYPPAPNPVPQPPPYPGPQPPPPGQYQVVEGAGINMRLSPYAACRSYYGTQAIFVVARGQKFACNQETCGHPYDWTRVYCAR